MSFIKNEREIALMRIAGKILRKTLEKLRAEIRPGVSGLDLDRRAREIIEELGGEPAFLGYRPDGAERPFPAALCVSINNVIVHGVPSEKKIMSGDVVKLDLGVRVRGYYADGAITVAVGDVSSEARKLISVTEQALRRGIRAARSGNTLGDIGHAIASVARAKNISVVKGLTGHGIGSNLHEDPVVYNEGVPGKGLQLKPGMTLALEPMFSLGSSHIVQGRDESYETRDESLSAHFEDTILITEKEPEILTML